MDDALGGPTKIGHNSQITVPKHIMEALGWKSGASVMFRVSDVDPGVLRVVPEAVVLRQLRRGEDAERMMRMTSKTEDAVDESRPNQ